MKTKRMSLYIVSLVLLVIMILGSLGVATWALLSTKLDVSGNIGFTGTGDVKATISQGAVDVGTVTQNEGKSPMQQVNITEAGASDSSSWAGLNIAFGDNANQLVINFSVTNNHPEKNLEIKVDAFTATKNNITVAVTTTKYGNTNPVVIAPDTNANYKITFTVGATNSKIERDFSLNYSLVNTDAEASVNLSEPTLDKLDFELNSDNSAYSVYGKSDITGVVVIPAKYNNLPVTSIKSGGFDYTQITSIIIPEGVERIGDGALDGCSSLKSVIIPSSVTYIGAGTFNDCFALSSLTFGQTSGTIEIGNITTAQSSGSVDVQFAAKWTDGTTTYEAGTINLSLTAFCGIGFRTKTWTIG